MVSSAARLRPEVDSADKAQLALVQVNYRPILSSEREPQ
jgi:hypothetical protein